jgi:hypothetical protein
MQRVRLQAGRPTVTDRSSERPRLNRAISEQSSCVSMQAKPPGSGRPLSLLRYLLLYKESYVGE